MNDLLKSGRTAEVRLERVAKRFGTVAAVRDLDLEIAAGEFVSLLGASGSGKTTCLRMVAGFERPTAGRILIAGRDVTDLPPYRRKAGMVFQSYALFPHKTVAGNVAFGLGVRGMGRAEIERRVLAALQLVHLESLRDRYPQQLSGGQKQRVAIARAVVIEPEVLLLDEPLGALDLQLREELQVEIKRVQQTLGITTLFVTHDQGEALGLSDRVAVMEDGRILQIDRPQALYERPSSRFVANFVGRTNLIEVVVTGRDADRCAVAARHGAEGRFEISGVPDGSFAPGETCLLATRPEHLAIGSDRLNRLPATVGSVTYRGSNLLIELRSPLAQTLTAVAPSGTSVPAPGSPTMVSWSPDKCFLLKSDTPQT